MLRVISANISADLPAACTALWGLCYCMHAVYLCSYCIS